MSRRSHPATLPGSSAPPVVADVATPVVTPDQVRALAAAIEQLANAIDVVTETGTPTRYADEHVQRARDVLGTIWGR